MMNLLKCKKGQADNYFAVITFLVVFGFSTIFAYVFLTQFIAAFSTTDAFSDEIDAVGANFLGGIAMFDWVIVLLLVVLIIGTGVTTFRLATTTVGFIITFIMAGFWGFVSYFFNIIFVQLVSDTTFTFAIAFFPNTVLIGTNLHWVMVALIIVGSIGLYAKRQKGQFIE